MSADTRAQRKDKRARAREFRLIAIDIFARRAKLRDRLPPIYALAEREKRRKKEKKERERKSAAEKKDK